MKHAFVLLAALLGSLAMATSEARAQTATSRVEWDMAEPVSTAQQNQYTFKADTAAAVPLTATCVASGSAAHCTAPIVSLASGTHTVVVTAINGFGSTSSTPLTGAPPAKPFSLSITVTVTVP